MTDRPSYIEKGFEAVENQIPGLSLEEILSNELKGIHHEQRRAIELHEGLDGKPKSWKEVAAAMGVSERTARRKADAGWKAIKNSQSRSLRDYLDD